MTSCEIVEFLRYGGHHFELIGCFDSDTPENEFDFYDLYVDGEHVNLGEPFYERPSRDEFVAYFYDGLKGD